MPEFPQPEAVLKDAPGPSPWYLRFSPPKINNKIGPLSFIQANSDGTTLLVDTDDNALVLCDMYCYFLPFKDGKLLVWYAHKDKDESTFRANFISFNLVDTNRLETLNNLPTIESQIKEAKRNLFYQSGEISSFLVPTSLAEGSHHFDFPIELEEVDELLILAQSTAEIYENKFTQCIFALRPKENRILIYPQDWFNNSNADFGYQWITRVARDPQSGKVFGEGFRINYFRLDDSLRQLEHLYDSNPFYGP